jgi:hypothetical protein
MRPKGKVIYRSLDNPEIQKAVREAHKAVVGERVRLQTQRAERRERPVPNWKCYPMVFIVGKNIDEYGNWLGGKLPKCRVCEGILRPKDNHQCEGYQPKFAEHDQEWHERQDARREEIRKAKRQREVPTCKWCGIDLPEFDDYDAHMSDGCPEMP